jgi:hypothetical protein
MKTINDYNNYKKLSLLYEKLKKQNNFYYILIFYYLKKDDGLSMECKPINLRNESLSIDTLRLIKSNPNFERFIL